MGILNRVMNALKPDSKEVLMDKVAKQNDAVLFTNSLCPNEVDYRATKNGIANYGKITKSQGKWSVKKL